MRNAESAADGDGSHNVEIVVRAGQVLVVDEVVFVDDFAVVEEADEMVVASRVQTGMDLRAEDAGVALGLVALHPAGNVFVVSIVNQEVASVLELEDVGFGVLIVVEGVEMVEVLLVDVEQHGVVGRMVRELQLVGRKCPPKRRFREHGSGYGRLVRPSCSCPSCP